MSSYRTITFALALAATLTAAAGCARGSDSAYDVVIDQRSSDLAASFLTFEARMERLAGTPAGAFAANVEFYESTRSTIESLKIRAGQREGNVEIVAQLDNVEESLKKLRALHEGAGDKGLDKAAIQPAIEALEAQCVAITKLELGKK